MWQDAGRERFGRFADLNAWRDARSHALWSECRYPGAEHLSVAGALTIKRDALMPMLPPFDGYVEMIAPLSSTCLISVERNKYSVPGRFANGKLSIHLYPERIEAHDEHGPVATHERSSEQGDVRYDWHHYIELIRHAGRYDRPHAGADQD